MAAYNDVDVGETRTYGRIKRMFVHPMYPGAPLEKKHVILECDWYESVGTSRAGLPLIKYNANFEACRVIALKDCSPVSCAFWPADPLNKGINEEGTYEVVEH